VSENIAVPVALCLCACPQSLIQHFSSENDLICCIVFSIMLVCVILQVPLERMVSFAEEFAARYTDKITSRRYKRAVLEVVQVHFVVAVFYYTGFIFAAYALVKHTDYADYELLNE